MTTGPSVVMISVVAMLTRLGDVPCSTTNGAWMTNPVTLLYGDSRTR